MQIKVGVSNRHVHLTKEDYMALFDSDVLEKKCDLSQESDYASIKTVTLKTPKGEIENVRIVGPFREHSQVEISKTDAYKLGINPPVRMSGDFDGALDITLKNGEKEIDIKNACILAHRHIHLNNLETIKYGLKNGESVSIKVNGERAGILQNVIVKVKDKYNMELHLDTDEANAFNLKNGDIVELMEGENEH